MKSTNDFVTIYPNQRGWDRIGELVGISKVQRNATYDSGYRDQLWHIIEDLHPMFFHSQKYFETTRIKFDKK